ncbi:hypothetical protein F9C11_21815 [Amycolatopsis sp. VS8301801F10]|uniref:hypothetical protein n=1 Tax=Amycolatopsis sp. VS8301801F10 TaxID=2652442 RepID=UPI0038FC552D
MTTNASATGAWTLQQRNNARQGRALLQSLFLGASQNAPLSANRSGVISTASDGTQAYDFRVTVSSGLTMTVQPGSAVVNRPGQGPYTAWRVPAAVSVTCDPAPATNPRNDLVVLRIYDAALGDVVPAEGPVAIQVITGSPGPTPADPVTADSTGAVTNWATAPVPSQAAGGGVGIILARAQVSTGGTITLTDLRRSTGLIGGVRVLLPGDSLTDPGYMPGDLSWYNGIRIWDGTTWRGLTPKTYQTPKFASVTVSTFPFALASVSIPDPGWPYQLDFDAQLAMTCGTGGGFDFVPRDGSASGANLAGPLSIQPADGRTGTVALPYTYAGGSDNVLTGARTVVMALNRWTGPAGNNAVINGNPGHRLTVTVKPA